ncbi:LOW QUALITY PROTEIN: FERM, ARHGEF and pleckstrin domain-containing protein 1-like [Pholidichthys leucotaenia]
MAESDTETVSSGAGQRLGAPETLGISTLDPGLRPPAMPPGRHVTIRVRMLDDTEELFDISQKASGKMLLDLVCSHMNLIEGDYFGLEFQNHQKMMVWLDHIKPIITQLRRPKHTILRFSVKFFPPDHAQLLEELTRYLIALQIKQDLSCGRLTCNDSSAALMVSLHHPLKIGDFEEQCRSHLLNNNYIPDQMPLIDKIMEFHSKNIGQTPAESDYHLLEVARRLEMYGIRLHPAKDREGTKLSLAVAHTGVLVFQGHTRINAFNWAKVRKLSFKRKRFLIKLRPDLNSSYQDTLEFLMPSRDCCKVFWKICVEYHAFFRLFEEPKPKPKPVLFTRGSSFRFSGRTQKQVIDYVRECEFKKIPFERKHSRVQYNTRVQHSIRLSPLPSPRHHEVPTEVSGVPRDRMDSPSHRHWKESVLVSAEDAVGVADEAESSHQRDVREDRAGSVSRTEETRGSARQTQVEHLNTGVVPSSPHLPGNSHGMVNGQKSLELCGHSPDGRQPSPLTSPLLNDACSVRTDDEDDVRRKRFPTDRAYFIAKELLTTERTYVKDLEVVTVSFQSAMGQDEATPDSLKNTVLSTFEPLHKFHTGFLREVEQRLALWEGRSNAHIKGDYQRIGDVMLKNLQALKPLTASLNKQSEVLLELEKACKASRKFEGLCRDFELQKVCYVPLNVFILRPLHRLIHYKQILERLCKHYPATHVDFRDCRAALADVSEVVDQLQGSLIKMENFQKLLELKKDLIGVDNLVIPGREFIRLGCLSKLSGKGLQQRMFFLFNDVILYTSRGMMATNQFRVNGQLLLHGMTIRESEDEWGVPHAFTLVGQQQSVVVAASSVTEMEKWMEDIKMAIEMAKISNGPSSEVLTCTLTDNTPLSPHRPARSSNNLLTFPECPEDSSLEAESEDDTAAPHTSLERPAPHRGNTMVHVCWHRNTSVSMVDFSIAVENQLSGNLLRKFKNSNGWQKLWVVFTNFSLFFYKSHQDDYPLASLPLLGYSVTVPSESENIHKDYVFKLHFKSHVYYFRSESEYTFERWMEVIRSATVSSSRAHVMNSKEPAS